MTTAPAPASSALDRHWFVVGRFQEYEGEASANLLRLVGIAAFYIIELINYHGVNVAGLQLPKVAGVDEPFHQAVTAVAVVWVMLALAVQLCLQRQFFPATLKFLSTAGDMVLLTCVLTVAAGPRSPLVVGYLLVILLSALRLNLRLIWFSTTGSILAYLVLLGFAKWFTMRDIRVPRYHQMIFVLALVLAGVILGQIIRRVRRLAEHYRLRVHEAGSAEPPRAAGDAP